MFEDVNKAPEVSSGAGVAPVTSIFYQPSTVILLVLIKLLVGISLIKRKMSLASGSFKPGSVVGSGSPVVPMPAMLKGQLKGGIRLCNMAYLKVHWIVLGVSWGLKKTVGINYSGKPARLEGGLWM